MGVPPTRKRLEALWGARSVEFYGCTEASLHAGGYSCPVALLPDGEVATHLMEDVAVWSSSIRRARSRYLSASAGSP